MASSRWNGVLSGAALALLLLFWAAVRFRRRRKNPSLDAADPGRWASTVCSTFQAVSRGHTQKP
jgi:hypothetical protein